MKCEAQDS